MTMILDLFPQPDYCAFSNANNTPANRLPECSPTDWGVMIVGLLGWAVIFLLLGLFFAYCWKEQTKQIERRRQGTDYRSRAYQLEFTRMKRVIYRERGRYCSVCGSTHRVEMHHILPRARGGQNTPSNLIPLCHRHHELMHGRRFG